MSRRWIELPERMSRRINDMLMGDAIKDVDTTKYTVVRYGKPQSFIYVDEGELRAIMANWGDE